MNGDFVTSQAGHFAERVLKEAPAEPENAYSAKVRYAFRLAFGREPTADELDTSATFLQNQRKHYADLSSNEQLLRTLGDLCQTLLSANEFIYLD
jgi:hypothetical protein